jgi:hypothetical protein
MHVPAGLREERRHVAGSAFRLASEQGLAPLRRRLVEESLWRPGCRRMWIFASTSAPSTMAGRAANPNRVMQHLALSALLMEVHHVPCLFERQELRDVRLHICA